MPHEACSMCPSPRPLPLSTYLYLQQPPTEIEIGLGTGVVTGNACLLMTIFSNGVDFDQIQATGQRQAKKKSVT
jgi:hypothetical protein